MKDEPEVTYERYGNDAATAVKQSIQPLAIRNSQRASQDAMPQGLDTAEQEQDKEDHNNDAKRAARVVAPIAAVRPSGNRTNQSENENDEKDCD
jgi:hypothetical protein